MAAKLLVVIVIVLIVGVALFLSVYRDTAVSRNLACRTSQETIGTYTGVGLAHTMNVAVRLRDSRQRIIPTSLRQQGETREGVQFETAIYYEDVIDPGLYVVEVLQEGRLIQEYSLQVEANSSPSLFIFCE